MFAITGRRILAQLGLYIQWRNRERTKKTRNSDKD